MRKWFYGALTLLIVLSILMLGANGCFQPSVAQENARECVFSSLYSGAMFETFFKNGVSLSYCCVLRVVRVIILGPGSGKVQN